MPIQTRWVAEAVAEFRSGDWCEDHYRLETIWGVRVEDDRGNRFSYCGPAPAETADDALALADRINEHVRFHPDWSPMIKADFWAEIDPCYGSDAYQSQGTEGERAARERADDPWYYADAARFAHTE